MSKRTWQIEVKLSESGRHILHPFHVAAVSSSWQFCVLSFLVFSSACLLLNFLPNSSFPLCRMIMSPKNVFLQVFNTLVFEAWSKWLLCLCFVVRNASCIKSPPSPQPACFMFFLQEEVLFCTAEVVEGLGVLTQVFKCSSKSTVTLLILIFGCCYCCCF